MNEKEIAFDSVVAQLGYDKTAPIANVSPRVAELIKAEADLADVKAELEQLKIQHKGEEAKVTNLASQLEEANAALKVYKDAEAAQKAAHIETLVDSAIADGKISADSKNEWVEMANTNLAMVEKTLAAISAREVISKEIANDPANVEAAEKSRLTTADEVSAKLKAALGEEFEFCKF